jgi:hypothetical protein
VGFAFVQRGLVGDLGSRLYRSAVVLSHSRTVITSVVLLLSAILVAVQYLSR